MSFYKELVLVDRNREERICRAEAFNTGHQLFVLIQDIGPRTRSGLALPTKIVRAK